MSCAKSNFQSFIEWYRRAPLGVHIHVISVNVFVGSGADQNLYVGTLAYFPIPVIAPIPRAGQPGHLLSDYLYGHLTETAGEHPEGLLIGMSDPVQVFWGTTPLSNIECSHTGDTLRVEAKQDSNSYEILLTKTTHINMVWPGP